MQPVSTRPKPFTREADFRQERDFGAKISATFEFIRANFRSLVKCLAYFVLPGALVAGIGLGTFNNALMNRMPASGASPAVVAPLSAAGLGATIAGGMGVAVLALGVSLMLIIGALYSFVRVRIALPATEDVQPGQVWAFMKPRLGRAFLAWLALGLAGGAIGVLLGLFFGVFVTSVFALPLLMLVLVVPFTWIVVVLSLFFPVLWLEDATIGQALRRPFFLIKGKWWSTFGVLFVGGIIQGFVAFVFVIPQYAVMFGKLLKIPFLNSDLLGIAAQCFYALGILFTYSIPLLAVMFQYFNLVERREGTGSLHLLSQLGQAPAPEVASATYRPDEEGEY